MSDDLQQVAECSGRKCSLYLQLHTAKEEEKDSAFSEPKPQLLLTKPKLNVPL